MNKERWSWKKVDGNFFIEFNSTDFSLGREFCVVDNVTGWLYSLKGVYISKGNVPIGVSIPKELCNKEFIDWSISTAYQILKYLPIELLTPDVIFNALTVIDRLDYEDIKLYTFKSIPEEVLGNAILKYPEIFTKIPNKYKTSLLVEKYASTMGSDYRVIPKKFMTVAAMSNGKFLRYVSESKKDKEVIDKAFDSYPIAAIAYIPKQFQTIDKQKKLIDMDVTNIWNIPNKYLLDETIDYALSKDISIFDKIIPTRKTYERCKFVLALDGKKLAKIPKENRTIELCLLAVATTPSDIRFVPKEILTKEFCDKISARGIIIPDNCLKYVGEDSKVDNLSNKSLEELFIMYNDLKKQLAIVEMAIDNCKNNISNVGKDRRD